MTLDYLQAICWSITYVFLILYGIRHSSCGIPLLPLALNYAWETVALFTTIIFHRSTVSFLMHGAWFILDTIIVLLFLKDTQTPKKKRIFVTSCIVALIIFGVISINSEYMFRSAYYMDAFMAVEFVMFALFKNVKKGVLSYGVALFKLLGDLFAWLNLYGIHLLTIAVLLCNSIYLLILLCKKSDSAVYSHRPRLPFFKGRYYW